MLVLDDLASLLKSEVALQILLSALEHPSQGDRGRLVKYRSQKREEIACFRSGIICITNREPHDENLRGAFKSRVNVLNYNPTDAQLGALMLDLADRGWPAELPTISPAECREVAEFVMAEILRRGRRFDLRLFVNKALPIYQQVKDGEAESDWRDLVTAAIEEELVEVRYGNGQSGPVPNARLRSTASCRRSSGSTPPARTEQGVERAHRQVAGGVLSAAARGAATVGEGAKLTN